MGEMLKGVTLKWYQYPHQQELQPLQVVEIQVSLNVDALADEEYMLAFQNEFWWIKEHRFEVCLQRWWLARLMRWQQVIHAFVELFEDTVCFLFIRGYTATSTGWWTYLDYCINSFITIISSKFVIIRISFSSSYDVLVGPPDESDASDSKLSSLFGWLRCLIESLSPLVF